MIFKAVMRYCG